MTDQHPSLDPSKGSRSRLDRFKEYYQSHEAWFSSSFFTLGFLFDVFTLGRIDDFWNFVSIGAFVFFAVVFYVINAFDDTKVQESSRNKVKQWIFRFRSEAFHFFIGGLLSMFSIFLFKSSSFWSFLLIFGLVFALFLANELRWIQTKKLYVKSIFLQICLIGFSLCTVPQLFGRVGTDVFVVSLLVGLVFSFFGVWCVKLFSDQSRSVIQKLIWLHGVVILFFFACYFFRILPPLPLSIQEVGIYHNVEKQDGKYLLSHEHSRFKFWLKGDQNFYATSGDRVYVFIRLFAPKGFSDKIYFRWQFRDQKGDWQTSDRVAVGIKGGRGKGFRGYSYKSNYSYGRWRVLVETHNSLEIGRINLEIIDDVREREKKPLHVREG